MEWIVMNMFCPTRKRAETDGQSRHVSQMRHTRVHRHTSIFTSHSLDLNSGTADKSTLGNWIWSVTVFGARRQGIRSEAIHTEHDRCVRVAESERVSGTNLDLAALLAVCVPQCRKMSQILLRVVVAVGIFGRLESVLAMRVFMAD